ncbi:MAG: serine hydrolase domain-containing protein [Acidobacteriota bacterium]
MKTALLRTLVFSALAYTLPAANLSSAKPEDAGMSSERLQRIAQMMERRIANGEMSGAAAIVARKGKIVYQTSQGVMDLESKKAVTPETMWRVASMTKPVTSVALMMMIEEGKVHLNDPVSRYIPEFKNLKVAVPKEGAAPPFATVAPTREVTVKDLLTHVSGLASGNMSNSTVTAIARKPGEKLADYIPRLGQTALEFQPGTRWAYSAQAGHDTLGRIVEIASGMPLNEFFQKRIFDPLGMKDISFWPSDAQWPRVASVYDLRDGKLNKRANPNGMSSNVYFMGSGGLISTPADYIPFGMMLANGGLWNGRQILGKKTIEMLSSMHVPDTLPGRTPGEGYGLGVRVVVDHAKLGTMLSNGTYGWSGVYGTHFFVDPVEGVVGVFMAQTSIREAQREFEDLVAQAIIQ